ncbi:MAG: TlpA disulfide reductase family protein [Deltaproteobacteria bacterium]
MSLGDNTALPSVSTASPVQARLVARIGLAITNPRSAFAVAADRDHPGRSGSDLLAAIAVLLIATQLRWLVQAAWLGIAVAGKLGLASLTKILTGTLTLELAALVIAALILFVAAGGKREPGRAFDIACVAALPPILVHLVAQTIVSIGNLPMPPAMRWSVEIASFGWMLGLVILAVVVERGPAPASPLKSVPFAARRAGWIVATLALASFAVQILWIAENTDLVRPLQTGAAAPAFSLARIGAKGQLGAHVSRTSGRITVVDFWATWCGPCLRSMPHLDQLARKHPEIDVLTINLDDAAEARAIFDRAHYQLQLLADDGETSDRFGVVSIPHTVLIDGKGMLRDTSSGELEAQIRAIE